MRFERGVSWMRRGLRDFCVWLVAFVVVMGFWGCAGVGEDVAPKRVEFHPILDGGEDEVPFEWEEDPEFPPRKPLPIDPVVESGA